MLPLFYKLIKKSSFSTQLKIIVIYLFVIYFICVILFVVLI